jgi:serine carboxypeptidase 1
LQGFVDTDGFDKINNYALRTERALNQGKFFQATDLWYQTEIVLLQNTGGVDFYNVLYDTPHRNSDAKLKRMLLNPRAAAFDMMVRRKRFNLDDENAEEEDGDKLTVLMRGAVRDALELPKEVIWGSQAGAVFDTLGGDFMKPVVSVVEDLLHNTSVQVVVYSGQLDLICATPGTVEWINNMKWRDISKYKQASRDGIGVNNVLEGYSRRYGNFSMYWVR